MMVVRSAIAPEMIVHAVEANAIYKMKASCCSRQTWGSANLARSESASRGVVMTERVGEVPSRHLCPQNRLRFLIIRGIHSKLEGVRVMGERHGVAP